MSEREGLNQRHEDCPVVWLNGDCGVDVLDEANAARFEEPSVYDLAFKRLESVNIGQDFFDFPAGPIGPVCCPNCEGTFFEGREDIENVGDPTPVSAHVAAFGPAQLRTGDHAVDEVNPAATIAVDVERAGLLRDLHDLKQIVDAPVRKLAREMHLSFQR